MSTDLLPVAHRDGIDALIQDTLAPQAGAIDQGLYPGDFMRALGRLGGFGAALPAASGGLDLDLAAQVDVIARVGRVCGSTAFLTWCQAACAWYLQQTGNTAARDRYLAPIARGEILAGTGMSNCVKHLAGIERINLRARRESDGYRVSGALPWVSNLGPDHLVIAAAAVEEGGYIMFVVPPGSAALTLRPCPAFSGMEGTGTYGVHLKNAWVPPEDVLAEPAAFEDYIGRIKPGFLLMQIGMGMGLVQASLETIHATNQRLSHVNTFLDDQEDTLERDFQALVTETVRLARLGLAALPLDILRARAQASEIGLRATQSAALHAGAAGYLMSHPAQRRLREALFVAIVTPALKHLRKEIHALELQAA